MTDGEDALSKQYHSLRFYCDTSGSTEQYYDTWVDFRLIPTERPTVALPKFKSKLVTVPGRTDPINLSAYLTGYPTYGNRSGSWSFYTDNDYVARMGGIMAFQQELHRILHGRIRKVVLRDDPGYFYVGEITLNPIQPGAERSVVTIGYNFYPFKKAITGSLDHWMFDDFDFQDGVIQYFNEMPVNGSITVRVIGSRERISPRFAGTEGLSVSKYENGWWVSYGAVPTGDLYKPTAIIPRLVIGEGENLLSFSGHGTVTIDYRRGLL